MENSFTLTNWSTEDYAALTAHLAELADEKYRAFHTSLVPGLTAFYGVRSPALRALAKQIAKGNAPAFLARCTDDSYEERILRGFVTGFYRWPDEKSAILAAMEFGNHINNWAVCDGGTAALGQLKRYPAAGFALAKSEIATNSCWHIRFGVVAILDYYLKDDTIDEALRLLCKIEHSDYYVKMAVAWALSVAFVKYREKTLAVLPLLKDDFTYQKTLQKCRESFRVTAEDKKLLLTMKRPAAQKERKK